MNANWLYFDSNNGHCRAGKCGSNINKTEWEYEWNPGSYNGKTYVRPHHYVPRCQNSYFMRRTWNNDVKSNCYLIRTVTGKGLRECMKAACDDKANTLNFYFDVTPRCEIKHCKWDTSTNDYAFEFTTTTNNEAVSVYGLEHTLSPYDSKYWVETQIPSPNITSLKGYYTIGLKDSYCTSESNFVLQPFIWSSISVYNCYENFEGTDWHISYNNDINCTSGSTYRTLIPPYPGTPSCNSSIFVIHKSKIQCYKSNCDRSLVIPDARDLRQCMLYACERGAPVINYYSDSTSVICDLRFCAKLPNAKYDFEYVTTGGSFDVYVLQHDTREDLSTTTLSTTSTAATHSSTKYPLSTRYPVSPTVHSDLPPTESSDSTLTVSSVSTPIVSSDSTPIVSSVSTPIVSSDSTHEVIFDTFPTVSSAPSSAETPTRSSAETPIVSSDSTPIVSSDSTPAVSSDSTPAVSSDSTPAVSSDSTPAVSSDSTPAVSSDSTPAVSSDSTPAVSSDLTPAVSSDSTPAVSSDSTPTVSGSTPAVSGSTPTVSDSTEKTDVCLQKLRQYEQEKSALQTSLLILGVSLGAALGTVIGVTVALCFILKRSPQKKQDTTTDARGNEGLNLNDTSTANETTNEDTYETLPANVQVNVEDLQYGNTEFLRNYGQIGLSQ
ncbi:unnamed protein product [Owenia fusiformis]|uniref:Uncharacterized protein n=1 Tax=Owenia fusiformis TaxID=6347 RepID=A0A8J1UCT2_OWEFU|nr:unnamed protein product [Owenia fusiformis]